MKEHESVLILAPHTDDGEFGCGGAIARFLEEGKQVYYVAFSTCRASVPEGEAEDVLEKELLLAMQSFGIPRERVVILDYPVRRFAEYRQNILDDMIRIKKEIAPTMVFAPSLNDVHQDHYVIAKEAMRAFKNTTLLAYEVPWNNFTFHNQVYITLSEMQLQKKIDAIACYRTQQKRTYAAKEFTIGQACVHGVQAGCKYAEVFEAVRWIF